MKTSRRELFQAVVASAAGLPLVKKLVPKDRRYLVMDLATEPSHVVAVTCSTRIGGLEPHMREYWIDYHADQFFKEAQ